MRLSIYETMGSPVFMFKKLFAAAVTLTAIGTTPSYAGILGVATFPADRDSAVEFSFYDNRFSYPKECKTKEAHLAVLSVTGANRGSIISEGCWEMLESGDAKVYLSDRYPVHGEFIIKKSAIKLF